MIKLVWTGSSSVICKRYLMGKPAGESLDKPPKGELMMMLLEE